MLYCAMFPLCVLKLSFEINLIENQNRHKREGRKRCKDGSVDRGRGKFDSL